MRALTMDIQGWKWLIIFKHFMKGSLSGLKMSSSFIRINLEPDPPESSSALDPHWFLCGSGFRVLMTKNLKKNLQQKKILIFEQKKAKKISLGLYKGCLRKRRCLHLSKDSMHHFQKRRNVLTFVGHFCPPEPGSSRPK